MSDDLKTETPAKRLTRKLQSVTLLYDLSSRLVASATMEEALEAILDAANLLHGAKKGRIQLCDPVKRELEMVASRGFKPGVFDVIRPFAPEDRFASARALKTRRPVVIDDVELDLEYAPYLDKARKGGYRAMIAAPLISSGGEAIGVLSIYFSVPHRPSRRELRLSELYARQAANVVARFRAERALKATEESLRLANRELYHRSKNMLAVIQSIAGQTLRATPDPAKFVEAFTGRLLAIDRAQSLLTGGGHQGVKINSLIREQAIIDKGLEGRFSLSGPELLLDPQLSLNLGLVFHELATNARKYGALSGPLGKVSVGWHVDERGGNRFLKLQWRESGGPKVVPPHSRGFGTVLIDRVARSSADADAGLIYPEDGILCTISVPMQRRAA